MVLRLPVPIKTSVNPDASARPGYAPGLPMLRQHPQLRVDLGRHGGNARQGVWGEGHARMLADDKGQQGRLGISTTAVSWAAGLARARAGFDEPSEDKEPL